MIVMEGMRQTCPNHRHRHRRVCIISARVSIPATFHSFSFEMVLGQHIMRMRRRNLVWNSTSIRWIGTVVYQHSAPYWTTLITSLMKILVLVWTLRLVAFHAGLRMTISFLALLILLMISWLQSPVVVTLAPKYVNYSTSSGCFPSIMTGSFTLVFLPQNLGLLCVEFDTSSAGCLAKTLSSILLWRLPWLTVRMSKSTVMEKNTGDRKHPCLNPVSTQKGSVTW